MNILLISEDKIKTNSNLNDNVWGKMLLPAIREAQEIGLQTIIGSCLYNAILNKIADGSIVDDENVAYKALLDDYIQDYLLYKVISDSIPVIGIKLGNIGTVISNDEHLQNISEDERNRLKDYYQFRADFYCRRMQEFLLENKDAYKELDCCTCDKIKANLKSAATTELWLGGARGKRL